MEVERIGFKDKLSTAIMNLEVFACTGILALTSILYYLIGYRNFSTVSTLDYVYKIIYIYLISISSAVFWGVIFYFRLLFGKKRISFKKYLFKVFSSFSFVSGGIIALLLPIGTKLYLVPLATFVGIVIGKFVFGGVGKNWINPAILGVLVVSFFFKPNYYLGEVVEELTSEVTFRTTPLFQTLAFPNSYSNIISQYRIDLWDIFNGLYIGEIGTTQSFALLIILVYLIGRKIVDYRLSLTYIFSYFIMSFILFSLSKLDISMVLYNSFAYTIVGPALFIGVFIISDPVTSPLTGYEKVVYATGLSFLTFGSSYLYRDINVIYLDILFINVFTKLVFKFNKTKKYNKMGCLILLLSLWIIFGFSTFVYLRGKNMLFFQ